MEQKYLLEITYAPWLLPIERLVLEIALADPLAREDERICRASGLGAPELLHSARLLLVQDGLLREEASGWTVTDPGKLCLAAGHRPEKTIEHPLGAEAAAHAGGGRRLLETKAELDDLAGLLPGDVRRSLRGELVRGELKRVGD
ncbi:MAG: hypothetical protein ACK57N_15170 [Planctomycetia bacterium]